MKRLSLGIAALLALIVPVGVTFAVKTGSAQTPVEAKKPIDTNNQAEIRRLLDRFATAFRTKDTRAVMALYEPGVVAFDLIPPLKYVGKDIYQSTFQKFFDDEEGQIEFEIRDLSITAGEDVAFSHCMERVGGTSKNGDKFQMWMRVTTGYRKINGKWLIVHDHFSVPTDLESGKAVLDLKP